MSDRRLRVIQRGAEGGEDELVAVLDRTVRVTLPSDTPALRHQLLALALVDLLGRLFPAIEVVCAEDAEADPGLPEGEPLLLARLEAVRRHGGEPKQAEGEPAVTVAVGPGAVAGADVYADARGWQSYVGSQPSRLPPDDSSDVPIGPLIAACRAANQVFQLMLGDRLAQPTHPVESSYASALTYESGEAPFDDPYLPSPTRVDAVLVGAGSIGGAAVYLLARVAGLTGEIDVVDDDVLAEHNPDRAILATDTLAKQGAAKVAVALAALAHLAGLKARPHQERFETFVGSRPRSAPLPTVLSAVDSVSSRREIQDAVPLEVIDAACGLEQISCSGHRTNNGPCVYCLHVGNVLDAQRIRYRLIAEATGFAESVVIPLLVQETPLTEQHLRAIEAYRREHGETIPVGAFDSYRGRTLETLYREKFLYGEALVTTEGGGQAAVAAPFVTAVAGFLLASEALKAAAGPDYAPYRLGPTGRATMYRENPWGSPTNALLLNPPRWPTHECLCRSPLRLRILAELYGL